MSGSVAHATLQRATFLLDQAARVDPDDRDAFRHFLESAIVFARSVTFHLQKQYAHTTGFPDWYSTWQTRLQSDPLARFLTEQRNYALKIGPIEVHKHVDLHIYETVTVSTSVSATIVRGKPWYRRSPRILFHDLMYPIRARVHDWLATRRPRSAPVGRTSRITVKQSMRFVASPWNDRPAVELLRSHLATLDELVIAAERAFGPGDPEAA